MKKLKPVRFTLIVKASTAPIFEIRPEEKIETTMEAALRAVKDVQKSYPNAEISVEVEV